MLTTPRIKDMAEELEGGMEEPEDGEESCDPCILRHQNPSMERILLPYTKELWQWLFTEDMVHGGFPSSSG